MNTLASPIRITKALLGGACALLLWAASANAQLYPGLSSARIQVTPRTADVYVDGHLAGTVDSFDGFLQRLDVPAGEHEITLYASGYKTVRQTVFFKPNATIKIAYAMEPLAPGTPDEPRPKTAPPVDDVTLGPAREARPSGRGAASFGVLAVRVQPRDATILIDGEEWTGPEGGGPMSIELSDGSHDVEVRKEGYTTYRRTLRVRAGETVALNVSLPK